MTAILIAAGALAGLTMIAGLALAWAHSRLPADDHGLIDAIDALLPQTQCGQCGHPGCRPYAEALAAGAPMDLCPPGGQETFAALRALLGRDDGLAPAEPRPAVARIRAPECIGCALCLAPCPVDAIVGAAGFMHTVIEDQCTGCELCLPACPVDCIELAPLPSLSSRSDQPPPGTDAPCIGCNRCEGVCPEALAPQQLLRLSRADQLDAAAGMGLERCIECRLCDRACPSGIPLAHLFHAAKEELADRAARQSRAIAAKARVDARNARLAAVETDARTRRAQRLAAGSARRW